MHTCSCQAQKLQLGCDISDAQRFTNPQYLPAGAADFGNLDALKTSSSGSSSSSCTSVLQAAMMIPELSTFVTTAQVCC